MWIYAGITLAALLSSASAAPLIGDGYNVPNDTAQCASDLLDWCRDMKFPEKGAGLSLVSIRSRDEEGVHSCRCLTNSEGTNCTKNNQAWFSCSKDNVFFYKGQQLDVDSKEGQDESKDGQDESREGQDRDICHTADLAFNALMVPNMSFDNSTLVNLGNGMDSLFRQLTAMQQEMAAWQRQFFDLMGGMFDSDDDSSTEGGRRTSSSVEPPSSEEPSSSEKNQIERE